MKPRLILPALTLRDNNGSIDYDANHYYAERASHTWIEFFLLSGSTGLGGDSYPAERARLLDLWLQTVPRERILATCWEIEDIHSAESVGVRCMVVLRSDDYASANRILGSAPRDALVYSHPRYSRVTFSPEVAKEGLRANVLPAGAKVSKVSTADICSIRGIVGANFELWHGSSRQVAASIAAGATGVVAGPLAGLPTPFPGPTVGDVQAAVDRVQKIITELPDNVARVQMLSEWARDSNSGPKAR